MENKQFSRNKIVFIIIGFGILAICLVICGLLSLKRSTTSGEKSSRCVLASTEQLETIRDGIKSIDQNNDIKTGWAVKSNNFKNIWFVAAKIYGSGMENGAGPGVWAISGEMNNPGMILSVDGFAKEFSLYPDASKTDASITMSDDGANDALLCAENE